MFASKPRVTARYVAPIPSFLAVTTPVPLAETHPVVEELADVAKDALNNLVRGALAGAGRHFTAKAEKTRDERLRRDFIDALHAVRLSAASVQRAYAVELERALSRPAAAMDASAGNPGAVQVGPLCQSLWLGLRDQMDGLSARLSVTPIAARFSPERMRLVARDCTARTDLSARTAELTRELLEQGVIAHLDQVYRRVAERLGQYSLPGAGPHVAPVANEPLPVSTAAASPAALHVDPHTKALLIDVAQKRESEQGRHGGYSNAHLAAELLESLKAGHETMAVRTRAIIQRLALVGRLFGSVAADQHLSPQFKERFEHLRFPLIKSALVDASFFTDRSHSLRLIAGDLVRKAANGYLSGQDAAVPVNSLLERCVSDFDLSAAFVRPAMAGLRALPSVVVDKFLAELQEDAQERAQWLRGRARELAFAAIDGRFMGKLVASSVLPLINEKWTEVLVHQLLTHGHDSMQWHDALRALDELMEHALGENPSAPLDEGLRQRLAAGLEAAGVSAEILEVAARLPHRIAETADALVMIETQDPALSTVETPDCVEPAREEELPPVPDALGTLLRSARWYRVYDHGQQKMRWLRLEAFYPKQDSLAFTEFDGTNPLRMQAGHFLDDLCSGRSAPCNPDAAVRRLIHQLQSEQSAA